jgi:AsnC family.
MSGDVDYLLKIVCKDIADYDRIYRALIKSTAIYDVIPNPVEADSRSGFPSG